ncbi:penicillin-binding transpeptidase domain-containing protein [Treponema phagedenis]|uniref:penicillin-binding transpeptidase domain-containing protein n=1 Tax=Treponema phagedenis TaxID=162 RepID=UPI0021CC7C20|nr:penicillin-binding transpeptidase domain-containing protein [Treponema phagedenis]
MGNAARNPRQNADVDMIQARRSSGSLLKPFLFAGLLDAGMLLPDQLMIDLPTRVGSYIPQNNSNAYSGAVPASEALSMSLNIPFVRALQAYTIPAFLHLLKRCGFTTFDRTADDTAFRSYSEAESSPYTKQCWHIAPCFYKACTANPTNSIRCLRAHADLHLKPSYKETGRAKKPSGSHTPHLKRLHGKRAPASAIETHGQSA